MIVLSAIMTACYEDKGNYDYIDLPEIKIEAKDTLYGSRILCLSCSSLHWNFR